MNWTPEIVELMKTLWAEGYSCAQIGRLLPGNPSRNAVIGKIHRIGLAHNAHRPTRPRSRKMAPIVAVPPPAPAIVEPPLNISILAIGFGQCRFPLWPHTGDPNRVFPCCGRPCAGLAAYCDAHMKLTGAAQPPRRRRAA